MHGGAVSQGGRKRARIEIIPLIDIIFFLLATFIMVSLSMTKNQGVQVALPTAGTAASLGDQAVMVERACSGAPWNASSGARISTPSGATKS